mgnify:CR=1 FL=1
MAADPHAAPFHVDDVPEESWAVGELQAKRRRLGAAAGAARLGVAIIELPPGARATPPHSHADEDEVLTALRDFPSVALLPVVPAPGKLPIRLIARAQRGATPLRQRCKPLVLNSEAGRPSSAAEAVLRAAQPLVFTADGA